MDLAIEPDSRHDSYSLRGPANQGNYNKIQILVDALRDAELISHAGPIGLEELKQGLVTENPAIKLDMQLKKHEFEVLIKTKDLSTINVDSFDRAVENAVKKLSTNMQNSAPLEVDITHFSPNPQLSLKREKRSSSIDQLEHLLLLLNNNKTSGIGKLSVENGVITITYPNNPRSLENMDQFLGILKSGIPEEEQGKVFLDAPRNNKNGTISLQLVPDYSKPVSHYINEAIKNVQQSKIIGEMPLASPAQSSSDAQKVIAYLKDKIHGESGGSPVTVRYQPASESRKGEFIISLDNKKWKNNDFLEKLNSFLPVAARKLDDTSNDRINFSIEARPETLAAYFDKHDRENFARYKNNPSNQR